MIRRALAVLPLIGLPGSLPAAELGPVTEVDAMLMNQLFGSHKPEAVELIDDSTVLGRLPEIDAALREKLPFGDDFIVHFAMNGDLLAWSDKSDVIEAGYWEIINSNGFNELCLRFGSFGLISLCAAEYIDESDWLIETVEGNPFGLVAGEAVPGVLAGGDLSLSALAERLP